MQNDRRSLLAPAARTGWTLPAPRPSTIPGGRRERRLPNRRGTSSTASTSPTIRRRRSPCSGS
jgi:hypothetical protein